jgi:ParB-like chromosome segregation protein Spo0J
MSWNSIKINKNASRALEPPRRKNWRAGDGITLVNVEDVIVPEDLPKPDPALVADIAESIRIIGLIHPIPVRLHLTALGMKTETILVTGTARFEAYKLLGEKTVPCIYFPDDEVAARFVRLSENLFRKNKTALQEAEEIAEFVELINAHQLSFFGQNVQKRGRPLGAAGKAARQLPIEAKTIEARRKKIERALKISTIYDQVKDLIREKHLDDSQSALLAIANEDQPEDQRKKVLQLSRRPTVPRTALKERMRETMPVAEQARYESLLAAWDASPEFRSAWRRAVKEHRERFINEVLRGTSGFDLDEAVNLIQSAFAGRRKILCRDLYRLGARYGFHKKTVQEVIRHLGYEKRRLSWDRREPWSYMNTNSEWKNQVPVIPNKEFEDLSPPKIREEEPGVDNHHDDDDDDDDVNPRQRYLEEQKEVEAELKLQSRQLANLLWPTTER